MLSLQATGARLARSGTVRRIIASGKAPRRQAVQLRANPVSENAFCVDKAFVLGAAAFQAYLDPLPDQGIVDKCTDGTETRFFDSEYVNKHFAGVLRIDGISARNLKDTDLVMGPSDGIVRASIGDSCAETDTIWNSTNPSWKNTLNVWVQKSEAGGRLRLKIFDDDLITSDDPLGRAEVPMSRFPPGTSVDLELPLKGKGADPNTTIKLTATFLAVGDNASDEGEKILEQVDDAETELVSGAPVEAEAITDALAATTVNIDTNLNDAWDALCSTSGGSVFNDKKTVAFINANSSGTQVWVSKDETTKTVLIAFRGTSDEFQDYWVDLNLTQADVQLKDEPELGLVEKYWNSTKLGIMRRAGVAAHGGFYRGWLSVRERLLRCVDNCTGGDPEWKVAVTGHSLGGALAILCAFELSNRNGPAHHISMYNYGGPRVGNEAFADSYTVKDSWRVHNEHDVVAKIPVAGLQGYRHIGTGVRILEDLKDYVFENNLGDKIEPEEVGAKPSFIKELLESFFGDAKDLLGQQAAIFKSIRNGEGIAAHNQLVYIGGLAGMLKDRQGGAEVSKRVLDYLAASRAADKLKKEQDEGKA